MLIRFTSLLNYFPKMYAKYLIWLCLFTSLQVSAAPTFSIVTENHPPVQYELDGKVVGTATEILRDVLSKGEFKGDIKVMPWARAYKIALSQKNTLIYSMLRTDKREHKFHWIGPISKLNVALIALNSRSDINVKTLSDAKGYVVGTIRNSYSHDFLMTKGFSVQENLFVFATMVEEVDLFAKGKIDLLLTDPNTIGHQLHKIGKSAADIEVKMWVPELTRDLYLAANINTELYWVNKITKAMDEVRKTERFQSLYDAKSKQTVMNFTSHSDSE